MSDASRVGAKEQSRDSCATVELERGPAGAAPFGRMAAAEWVRLHSGGMNP